MKQHKTVQQLRDLAIRLGLQVLFSQITPKETIYMVLWWTCTGHRYNHRRI